jgi:hypothetical protein
MIFNCLSSLTDDYNLCALVGLIKNLRLSMHGTTMKIRYTRIHQTSAYPRQSEDIEYIDAHPCPKLDVSPGSKIPSGSKIRALDGAVTFVFVAVVLGTCPRFMVYSVCSSPSLRQNAPYLLNDGRTTVY